MRIHFDLEEGTLDYEREPMPPARFKALCGLAVGAMVLALVITAMALCGLWGLGIVAALAFLGGIIWSAVKD